MLQNTRVTASTVSESLRENQQGGGGGGRVKITLFPTQIRIKKFVSHNILYESYKTWVTMDITLYIFMLWLV